MLAPTGASAQRAGGGAGGVSSLVPSGHGGSSVAPWTVIGCVGGTVLSAMIANWRDNRELTFNEAASCGMLFWFAQPVKVKVKVKAKPRKKARRH